MRSFCSDNNSGVHPLIMKAITDANTDHAVGYGDDKWTDAAVAKIRENFGDCEPLFVFNGTGSNVIALQCMTRTYQTIFCAETGHIFVDECGAPARFTGCSVRAIPTADGKLTPGMIEPYLTGIGEEHHSQPGAIYISQCTELGTIYTPQELKKLTTFAHKHGMKVHMDGARISNAAASLGKSLKEVSKDGGIDTLTLGGTKNGLIMGECILIFNEELKAEAKFYRKQAAQLASKMRYLSCQFTTYLTDGLWKTCADNANKKSFKFADALKLYKGISFTQKIESNQLFLTMPKKAAEAMLKKYHFYIMKELGSDCEIRLVCSWDTTDEDIDAFLVDLSKVMK